MDRVPVKLEARCSTRTPPSPKLRSFPASVPLRLRCPHEAFVLCSSQASLADKATAREILLFMGAARPTSESAASNFPNCRRPYRKIAACSCAGGRRRASGERGAAEHFLDRTWTAWDGRRLLRARVVDRLAQLTALSGVTALLGKAWIT